MILTNEFAELLKTYNTFNPISNDGLDNGNEFKI